MQNSQLDRLLKLAKRTGDRLIVTGNDGTEPVVILPLTEYEGMLDSMTFFRGQPKSQPTEDAGGNHQERADAGVEEDFDPVALENQVMAAMVQEEPRVVPVEAAIESAPEPVSEEVPRKPVIRRAKPEDDGGEERFYLEAV